MAKKLSGSNGKRGISQLRRYLKKADWPFLIAEDGELRGLAGGDGHQWHWSARVSHCSRFLEFYC
jgi:hypothetical protein